MQSLRLFWSSRSPFARKVTVASRELGIENQLELVPVTVALATVNSDVAAHNPLSKIPTLVLGGGRALFDSAVICEYLDARAGGRLFPDNPEERWEVLTLQAMADGLLDGLLLYRTEKGRDVPSPAILEALQAKRELVLDRLEAIADGLRWDQMRIGEIAVGCALSYLDFRFQPLNWRDDRPELSNWYGKVAGRPSFVSTHFHDN